MVFTLLWLEYIILLQQFNEEMGSILQIRSFKLKVFFYCSSIKVFPKDVKLTSPECWSLVSNQNTCSISSGGGGSHFDC